MISEKILGRRCRVPGQQSLKRQQEFDYIIRGIYITHNVIVVLVELGGTGELLSVPLSSCILQVLSE